MNENRLLEQKNGGSLIREFNRRNFYILLKNEEKENGDEVNGNDENR
jgi:hypothetical protein